MPIFVGTYAASGAGRCGKWRRCAAGENGTASWASRMLGVWTVDSNSTLTRWFSSWTPKITCTAEEPWSNPERLVSGLIASVLDNLGHFCWNCCLLKYVWIRCWRLPTFSPQSQHRVAANQHERFDKWHQGWLASHVTSSAERSVQNWLMGEEEEDMIPCKTTCLSTEVKGHTVNRYQVHYSSSKAPASP